MTYAFAQRTESRADSARWFDRARMVIPSGTTRSTLDVGDAPPYFAAGQGFLVRDLDGHEVIDLQNNYTSLIHGHAREEVSQAAVTALGSGASIGLPTPYEVVLAEDLVARFSVLEQLRFANSGTEAVMMAVRTARAFTGRHLILRFADAYHGAYDDVVDGAHTAEDALVLPYDDVDALRAATADCGDALAAILVDLLPNRAGLRPASDEFVEAINQLAARTGALIIADEVITARLAVGGLAPQRGLQADLMALGKIIGGGFAIGAFGGRADVMRVFDRDASPRIGHGGTFTANPVAMAAGKAAMDLYGESEIARINVLGERLRAAIDTSGVPVTGHGSLSRLHVDDEHRLWWTAYRSGVLIGNNGLLAISTAMDERTIDEIAQRLDRIFEVLRTTS